MGNALSCIERHAEGWDRHSTITTASHRPSDAVSDDMDRPLSHYFISSGHNSYLTGNQLNSLSGIATIVSCLKANCRVIELDVYNQQGDFAGPVCKHGGTLTAPVAFKDCIEAIAKNAFVTSPFPVIVTLENHTDDQNQVLMADTLMSTLGALLYVPAPGEAGQTWKSPNQLKNKVLIRCNASKCVDEMKRLIYISNTKFTSLKEANDSGKSTSSSFDEQKAKKLLKRALEASGVPTKAPANASQSTRDRLKAKLGRKAVPAAPAPETTPQPNTDAASAMGSVVEEPTDDIPEEALANVHSLGELYAYTAHNLMRVYPGGLRVDSSNYNPTIAWSAGASFAALNWQTWDEALWINAALFSLNGGCGYVLKPTWMVDPLTARDSQSGSFTSNPLPRREPARTLAVTIHSAYIQQSGTGKIACFKDDIYAQIELLGMPMDNQQQRTPTANNTGRLLVNETYVFKVLYPEVAVLLIKIKDQDLPGGTLDDVLGHWEIAVPNLVVGKYKVLLQDSKRRTREDRWIKIGLEWLDSEGNETEDLPGMTPAGAAEAAAPSAAATPDEPRYYSTPPAAGGVPDSNAPAAPGQVLNPLAAGVGRAGNGTASAQAGGSNGAAAGVYPDPASQADGRPERRRMN